MLRSVHIANDKKRDASVGFEGPRKPANITMLTKDNEKPVSSRILKATGNCDIDALLKLYDNDLMAVGQAIIDEDPDVDLEHEGMKIGRTNKVYLTKDGRVLYGVDLYEIVYNPDGTEKDRRYYAKTASNINVEAPVKCTGKTISKSEAVRRFVFGAKYQIKHINGLTYDFLYDIAKQLHESDSLMIVGAGKGNEPLVFQEGGTPWRAFLEGRIDGKKYMLIMHLTNLELKELVK